MCAIRATQTVGAERQSYRVLGVETLPPQLRPLAKALIQWAAREYRLFRRGYVHFDGNELILGHIPSRTPFLAKISINRAESILIVHVPPRNEKELYRGHDLVRYLESA